MYSNFKEQAIEYVRQAVAEDNAGNYARAFPLYMNALEYFKTHLKYEKNPKIKEAITQKFTEYLRRAEEIRAVLDEGGPDPRLMGMLLWPPGLRPNLRMETMGRTGTRRSFVPV
ncbi:UNVERIFIED_CONTAM: protein SUPPRESSOR OF K(+) TRANSPORT GROWTH DEFECT 1 [Sesamum calycinum]|uniref:Protein SUPPRESSOR OF K(+) TRANSPORT GROWTH DEFECT 1 n=1 Tax=Sesamum calycinum TaxID=2727403 RepID=A0AAW2SE89_9LAMI